MRGIRYGRAALLLILAFTLPHAASAAAAPAGWAVLMEYNTFQGRYPDLPVGYVNSTRMLAALVSHGWMTDHVLLVRDSRDPAVLPHSAGWLVSHVRPGDTVVFYVAGEYRFLARDLGWDARFPRLWQTVPTSHRVLIAETCYAERLTDAATSTAGMGLPAVGRHELDWWGLHDRDGLIRGGTFTFFLTRALAGQPTGAPLDFPAAFAQAVTAAQEYFHTTIAPTPGALDAFHALGSFPEHLATFPNPRLARGADDLTSPVAVIPP